MIQLRKYTTKFHQIYKDIGENRNMIWEKISHKNFEQPPRKLKKVYSQDLVKQTVDRVRDVQQLLVNYLQTPWHYVLYLICKQYLSILPLVYVTVYACAHHMAAMWNRRIAIQFHSLKTTQCYTGLFLLRCNIALHFTSVPLNPLPARFFNPFTAGADYICFLHF